MNGVGGGGAQRAAPKRDEANEDKPPAHLFSPGPEPGWGAASTCFKDAAGVQPLMALFWKFIGKARELCKPRA